MSRTPSAVVACFIAVRRRRPKKRRARSGSCGTLANQAFRRPVSGDEVQGLLELLRPAARTATSKRAFATALQAMLASPQFMFRLERAPAGVRPGQNYRISDIDLASRLSYFIWGTVPDQELVERRDEGAAARARRARRRRCGACWRIRARKRSATRFASLWLRLQDLDKIHPDALTYPKFDHYLAEAMRRETELLFETLIHEDRSVLELLTADWTFVNERLARHYGIPNITGDHFRRVQLTDENRRGLLGPRQHPDDDLGRRPHLARPARQVGHGSAARLAAAAAASQRAGARRDEGGGRCAAASVRERMEQHRKNPACTSCHRVIDPLGLALENFDVTGAVAHQGQRRADRSVRHALRRHRDERSDRACDRRC